jgi:hypothetical protein
MKNLLDKAQIKICHLTTGHLPFDGRIFHKEAKTLVKGGYEVVLIGQHSAEEVVDGVKIIPLPTPKNRFGGKIVPLFWRNTDPIFSNMEKEFQGQSSLGCGNLVKEKTQKMSKSG